MLLHFAETMAFAIVGGTAVGMSGMPGGWLSGAILLVAIASLLGRPMHVPARLNRVIFAMIGMSLGSVVTPETLHGVATYPLSIVILLVAMTAVGFLGAAYLRFFHKWDRVSAFLGSAPGGLSQCVAVGAELDADVRGIAIVQTVRVFILALGLPSMLTALGLVAAGAAVRPSMPLSFGLLGELAILAAACAVGATLAYRVHFPGGILFGAMLTSALLHGSSLIHAALPWWVVNAAMIAMGAITGSRFADTPIPLLLRYIGAALGAFFVAAAIAAGFAALLVFLVAARPADVMVAYAPGSVDAMMLLALALNTDPVYVGAHHVSRIFFVSLLMPAVARRSAKLEHKPIDESKLPPPTPDDED